jgi:hypothetical protein
MADAILDNASFQLIRTNPKLTTNIKVIVNSSGKIFLESFNANEVLSSSLYKAVPVDPTSSYDKDLANFYSARNTPKEIAYVCKQNSEDTAVLPTYDLQYEMFYASGTEAISSEAYIEDLGILAPLWLEDQIPDNFLIFRIDDPVNFNLVGKTNPLDGIDVATTSDSFTEKVLESCTLIKTFDLTSSSDLGKYIRNYRSQQTFPESPYFLNLQSDQMTQYRGISYADGRFIEKGEILYKEFYAKDKSIIEQEYFTTSGFERNGVVVANIMNLEFLFSDSTAKDYTINRYFGLYADFVEEGTFKIDSEAFYLNAATEKNQQPALPQKDALERLNNFSMTNPNGIVLYYQNDSVVTTTGEPTFERVNELNSIFTVKDKTGSFHSLKKGSKWQVDSVRLSDTNVNIPDFSGYTPSVGFFDSELLIGKGKSSVSWKISGEIPIGYTINFYDSSGFTLTLESNAVLVDSKLGANSFGKSFQYFFNGQGQPADIAKAIVSALNFYKQGQRFFNAVAQGGTAIFFSRFGGSRFNRLNFQLDTTIGEITELTIFPRLHVPETGGVLGRFYFTGGSDYENSRIKIPVSLSSSIVGKYTDLKSAGKAECLGYGLYLDEPVFDINGSPKEFKKVDTYVSAYFDEDKIKESKSGGISIYDLYDVPFGRFSIYPIRDFDFDFYSSQYSEEGELAEEYNNYNQNVKVANSSNNILLIPVNQGSYPNIVNFYKNGGFTKLQPVLENVNTDQEEIIILSEYDRLFENFNKNLALFSRTSPFVCKWVYDDYGKDVRNKPYRLNFSDAFGTYNFSPSPLSNKQDPISFSHEWYYLSKVPSYFTEDGLMSSWSYFNFTVDDSNGIIPGFFQDTASDNFSSYFIVDHLFITSGSPIFSYFDKQIRYTKFKAGNSQNFSQTFFRGVKVIVKERVENTIGLNYNIDSIQTTKNSKFNDYKFAAILVPTTRADKPNFQIKIINNKKWKTITVVIFLKTNYVSMQPDSDSSVIDRTLLYNLQSIISAGNFSISGSSLTTFNPNIASAISGFYPSPITAYNPATYSSTTMTGWINPQTSTGNIGGIYTIRGVGTKFLTEISEGNDGLLKDIVFNVTPDFYQISQITEVLSNGTLIALSVKKNGSDISLPIGGSNLTQFKNGVYGLVGGGYEELIERMNLASFSNINTMINRGAPEVIYETINETGQISYNDFLLELSSGSLDMKSSYLRYVPDPNKPTSFNLQDVVGYELAVAKNPGVGPIYRQPGHYNIKFVDLFKFKDPYIEQIVETLNPTTYVTNVFNLCRYKNTQFDPTFPYFGQIRNYFFHKVNSTNPGAILELSSNTSFRSLYPLIGEVAIDKRSKFYVFSSSWDPGYFATYLTKTERVLTPGTLSSIERKSFFGSKYLKVPQSIVIDTLNSSEFSYSNSSEEIIISIDLQARFTRFFRENLSSLFMTYVNPAFTNFSHNDINQFINSYIEKNVIPLYTLNTVNVYLKEEAGSTDDFSWMSKTNLEKSQAGLIINKNFGIQKQKADNLNFDTIYRKKLGYSISVGVSINLTKK